MTDRPTNEVTGKIVAKWKGWSVPVGRTWMGRSNQYQSPDTPSEFVDDPRDDTDAALELLWELGVDVRRIYPCNGLPEGGWVTQGSIVFIPISGEPFRYAIVNLAAKVWGVE